LDQRLAILTEYAEGSVASTDDVAGRVDYLLQHVVEVVVGEDRHAGREETFEPFANAGRFESGGHA
jgi:hypothetical protein